MIKKQNSQQIWTYSPQRGVGMIEVLISLLILSVGLLGMASLQARSLSMTTESLQRTQATILANDIIERARANRINVADYATAVASAAANCDIEFALDSANTVATNDVNEWRNNLACLLANGNGSVIVTGNNLVVTVTFQDRTEATDEGDSLIDGRDRLVIRAGI